MVDITKTVGVTEAAEMLSCSVSSLRSHCERGTLRAEKLLGQWRITVAALQAFAAIERAVGRPPKPKEADRDGGERPGTTTVRKPQAARAARRGAARAKAGD